MEPNELQHIEGKHEEITTDVDHPKQGEWHTFPFIIGTAMSITLAAAGLTSNLLVYLITEFNVKSINAAQINNVFLGCFSLFPIAGAIVADSFFSPFHVITISSFISLLGVLMLTLIATVHSLRPPHCANDSYICETPSTIQYAILYGALALATIGFGGTRYTISAMGANQFENANDQGIFFNWFFLAFNIANVISYTAIIYIQDNVSWGLSYGICAIANAISIAFFLLGKRFYRHIKSEGSPFTGIARVMVAAIRKRKMLKTSDNQDYCYNGSIGMSMNLHRTPTKSFRFLNRAALKTEHHARSNDLCAKSWRLCTVEEVEDVKTLINIIPLWSTGILLLTLAVLSNNLTILQALTMDRHLGSHFKIPAGTFVVFNLLACIISLLILDHFLIPMFQNLTRRPLTLIQRVGIGHIFNTFAVVGSALIEVKRLNVVRTHHLMNQPSLVVPISALWLLVPQIILGIAESFYFSGQTTFYYQEFPMALKSTSTAMFSMHIGIGYYLSTAIIDLVHRTTNWLPNNINDGRLDNVYWMLAVIGVMNLGYYLACAKLFKHQNTEKHDEPSCPV